MFLEVMGLLEFWSAQAVHHLVARHYGVPVVSFRDVMLACGGGPPGQGGGAQGEIIADGKGAGSCSGSGSGSGSGSVESG